MTRLWTATGSPGDTVVAEIGRLLRAGGVVLLPTDTIYGLHGVALNARAAERIAQIKGRDDEKPFVVLAASVDQLSTAGVSQIDARLEEIWPAPLTAILPLRDPTPASRGALTLAVRIPALEWLRSLMTITGPLISTSANRSGERPVTAPSQLPPVVAASLDGMLDAGEVRGTASAIIDFTGDEPRLVREGEPGFSQKVWKRLRKSL